jgi:SEC-C motif-containing protein
LHRGADAATAEELMRSRFSAFAVGDQAYLGHSWHPDTRPRRVRVEPGRRWLRLEVLDTAAGGLLDDEGVVAFAAHSERAGRPEVLRERSWFVRYEGRWVYVGPAPAVS